MKCIILFNPLAGKGKCTEIIEQINIDMKYEPVYTDITSVKNYNELISDLKSDDVIVICGGDGTLNRFINSVQALQIDNDILYYPSGSGNDFMRDLNREVSDEIFSIKPYIKKLPYVIAGGQKHYFLNGIGYGVDGYCCAEGNRLRKLKNKNVNYTMIAVKALLFKYKPSTATLSVDGKEYKYSRVWMAPTMKGRFFGGGMKVAPDQNRHSKQGEVTVVVAHNLSRLNIVRLFPSVFKGKHTKFKKYIDVHTGHNITIKFDHSTDMQIDGETLTGITEYAVNSGYESTLSQAIR